MATTNKITTRSSEVENSIGTINNETLTIYIKQLTLFIYVQKPILYVIMVEK